DGDGDLNVDGAAATLGQSWSEPTAHVIKTSTSTAENVFLMAGGYDENQDKPLYVYDPVDPDPDMSQYRADTDTYGRAVFAVNYLTGAVSKLNVNAGNFSDMTHCIVDVQGFDTNGNMITNRVYAGDLGGNIFAFEDDDGDGTWSRRKFFSSSETDSVQRKIFYAPDAIEELFGQKLAEKKGWFIRLDQNAGEKVTSSMLVYNGVVYFTTYTPDTGTPPSDPCETVSGHGLSRLYALNYQTGEAAFEWSDVEETDNTEDHNIVHKGRLDRSMIIGTSIASAPVIAMLRGGPEMYIAGEDKIGHQSIDETKKLRTFFWRQLNN
ncbi:MAG: hypothetical protein P8012_18150, partial [Desulfobacterales bacterium]